MGSFNFMLFFFIFFCQFMFSCIMALGIPGSGGAGIITAIGTFTDKEATGGTYFVGCLILCIAVGFAVAALADFFMLTKIHGYYRATGASLSKAQAEFTSNVLSNEGVRNAAAQPAAAAVGASLLGNSRQDHHLQQTRAIQIPWYQGYRSPVISAEQSDITSLSRYTCGRKHTHRADVQYLPMPFDCQVLKNGIPIYRLGIFALH